MWCLVVAVLVVGCAGQQQESGPCYPAGGVAGIVVATVIATLAATALVAALLLFWKKGKGRRGNGHNFAFDNPHFQRHEQSGSVGNTGKMRPEFSKKNSLRSSKLMSEASMKLKKNKKHRGACDDSCLDAGGSDPERTIVSLRGHDFTGLGFNICGNMRDGILVKDVLHRGPASESGLIKAGDKIVSVRVSFGSMVYEDALTILSYASPYDVQLEVERITDKSNGGPSGRSKTRSSSFNGGRKLFHPLYRSQSIDDLTQIDQRSLATGSLNEKMLLRQKNLCMSATASGEDLDAKGNSLSSAAEQQSNPLTRKQKALSVKSGDDGEDSANHKDGNDSDVSRDSLEIAKRKGRKRTSIKRSDERKSSSKLNSKTDTYTNTENAYTNNAMETDHVEDTRKERTSIRGKHPKAVDDEIIVQSCNAMHVQMNPSGNDFRHKTSRVSCEHDAPGVVVNNEKYKSTSIQVNKSSPAQSYEKRKLNDNNAHETNNTEDKSGSNSSSAVQTFKTSDYRTNVVVNPPTRAVLESKHENFQPCLSIRPYESRMSENCLESHPSPSNHHRFGADKPLEHRFVKHASTGMFTQINPFQAQAKHSRRDYMSPDRTSFDLRTGNHK